MSALHRLLDANLNRAREALRVMEDVARFTLDHAPLASQLKSIRHELRSVAEAIPGGAAILGAWRDTPGDVGVGSTAPQEHARDGPRGVALAAGKRAGEALRAIEEACKAIPGAQAAAERVAPLRYRLYEAEKRLTLALAGPRAAGRFDGWRCCVLVTESLCVRPWLDVAREAAAAGADCIQLREKDLPDREVLSRARALIDAVRPLGAAAVVNDRPDLALLCGADGAHLGQTDMTVEDARRLAGDSLILGVSTANLAHARAALHDGADYCGVGPMFPTTTKHKPALSGPAYLRDYLAHTPELPPALAISGVTPDTIPALRDAAASAIAGSSPRPFGVAVSSFICAAPEPAAATRAILSALEHSASHPLPLGERVATRSPPRRTG